MPGHAVDVADGVTGLWLGLGVFWDECGGDEVWHICQKGVCAGRAPDKRGPTHPKKLSSAELCITRFQTQRILTACQIRYHSHLWDHRSTGQL